MEDFNSKYTGKQVEDFLDQIANGEIGGGITAETDPIFSASPAASITEGKKAEWDNKQDAIADLENIREGARLGSTALQEHQDISHLADKSEIEKVSEDVAELKGEVETLIGTGEGSVVDIASKEVAKVIDSAPETMDTLKKIADLIEKDAEQAADILATLGDHESRIATLEDKFVVMSEAEYDTLPNKEDKFYFCYDE